MKIIIKRMASLILTTTMLISAIMISSFSACAVEGKSGRVNWKVSGGVLTISRNSDYTGAVEMDDYNASTARAPWYSYSKDIKIVKIGNNISKLGKYAFYGLNSATSISIGKDVEKIETGCFGRADSLLKFSVDSQNSRFKVINDVLYTANGGELISFPASKTIGKNDNGVKEFVIPPSVTTVRAFSFNYNKNIEKITHDTPGNIVNINTKAFANCTSLKIVVVKNNCKKLENQVFYGSKNLRSLTLPPSITNIGTEICSPSNELSGPLRIYCAKDSVAYKNLKDCGYILTDQEWTFNVKFDPDGGRCIKSSQSVTWNKAYGSLPSAEKTGYSFDGWYLNGSKIESTTIVETPASHTVVAKYIGNPYKIILNPLDGYCDKSAQEIIFGESIGDLPVPTRNGYTFIGWFTEGNKRVYSDTIFNDESIKTLYAHYLRNVVAVTNLRIKYKSKTSVTLFWDGQKEITGYSIYAKKNNGSYIKYQSTTRNSIVLSGLSSKVSYKFKVSGYNRDSVLQEGDFSDPVSRAKCFVNKPKIKKKYLKKKNRLTMSWKKIKNAYGYHVYKYKKGKWKKVKSTQGTEINVLTKKNKTYSYKVRAYTKVLGHKIYSKYVKIKHKT